MTKFSTIVDIYNQIFKNQFFIIIFIFDNFVNYQHRCLKENLSTYQHNINKQHIISFIKRLYLCYERIGKKF